MKEALIELFSEVPGLKKLMEKPSTVPPSIQGDPIQGLQRGDQTKRKRRLCLAS